MHTTAKSLLALTALLPAAFSAAAQDPVVEFRGRVDAGPLPWCTTVQGYEITSAKPQPPPGSCIRGTGRVSPGMASICMTGTILTEISWRPWRGCK